ncbi:SAM-dependent methyltransferase [Rhizorhabdus argentea]|uniref:SAM-dependent methyltransferase n=1 Tax=Rhizorhabdus argentea TaxID=1387174 RepID=UPI0030EE08E4
MDLIAAATAAVERLPLPDAVTLAGVEFLVGRTGRKLARQPDNSEAFARTMGDYPIAIHVEDANAQHYEVPAAFFDLCLGPRRKYSCCYYEAPSTTIAEAEDAALAQTVEHARLADGQHILELGCGWGSLSLYMAARYPNARITAVSNSHSQRRHIEKLAAAQGSTNLNVVTCDMNDFQAEALFDRVVSVEMFEHMSNWEALLTKVKSWLRPDGYLFIHIFTHDGASYRFDHADKADWIAQHFFTGGIMPSHSLIGHFPKLFAVEEEWRWNGEHYARTAFDWLARFDVNQPAIAAIFRETYGKDAQLWERRWRLFFLATAGLFRHQGGGPWAVSHYRLKPAS